VGTPEAALRGVTSSNAARDSQDDEQVNASERLSCRVANLVPVDDIDAAVGHLTVHFQTIDIGPDSLRRETRDQRARPGGQRIVSLGFATAGNLAGLHDAIEPLHGPYAGSATTI
jgi:hypothetical protein